MRNMRRRRTYLDDSVVSVATAVYARRNNFLSHAGETTFHHMMKCLSLQSTRYPDKASFFSARNNKLSHRLIDDIRDSSDKICLAWVAIETLVSI